MTRKEAAEIIRDLLIIGSDWEAGYYSSDGIEALEMAIEALEQPEQKKSKWKDHTCTNCGTFIPPLQLMFAGKVIWRLDTISYCPNCGAEMEKE